MHYIPLKDEFGKFPAWVLLGVFSHHLLGLIDDCLDVKD